MKVVGFTGSPRNGSNTEILVEKVLEGARETGAETKIFNLSKMNIAPCKACGYCKANEGECNTQDDMQIIYRQIKEADAFILGSPVYMWQMSAQSKLFTDRLYATFGTDFEEKYGKKNMALVFSQGNPDENMFREYFNYTKNMFNFLGYNVTGLLSSQGNMVPGEVKNKADVMDEAKNLGLKLFEG
ncbi:MAG TPA: flavodoxin family protein [Methanobacteriaceae archaeon]|nr:flavodoxin family protein [Methanobacteriaceae archaeon]